MNMNQSSKRLTLSRENPPFINQVSHNKTHSLLGLFNCKDTNFQFQLKATVNI